ncbi:MAG: 7-cyano-7-deazaguanine synthase QueC [Acidobacteria bacterium]|nr:7-cyano-7-deazaguanine synthase QueC [Acidobacteriota bacterium]
MMRKAVVLVSGGLDSCVTAAMARQTHELALLHVQYGQRTQDRELAAFHSVADALGASHRLVTNLDHLHLIGGSSLTDKNMAVSRANLQATEVPSSYVPFRNAHLLAIATSWAEVIGATDIFIGAVEEDSSGYPDCRRSFFDAFEQVIDAGTRPETKIHIRTPLIHKLKSEIVATGFQLDAPLHATWSCYQATELACGTCDSCALRLRGFYRAGETDPIPYADDQFRVAYK